MEVINLIGISLKNLIHFTFDNLSWEYGSLKIHSVC